MERFILKPSQQISLEGKAPNKTIDSDKLADEISGDDFGSSSNIRKVYLSIIQNNLYILSKSLCSSLIMYVTCYTTVALLFFFNKNKILMRFTSNKANFISKSFCL